MQDPALEQLQDALTRLAAADEERAALALHIWTLAKLAVPQLDALAKQLWADDSGVAAWFCREGAQPSPAQLVGDGRSDIVIRQILQSLHGVYS